MAKRKRIQKPDIKDRRKVRYILFRIKRGLVHTMDRDLREIAPAIEKYIEKQIVEKGFHFTSFTFDWDVAADDPLEVIGPDIKEWVDRGGSFEGKPVNMSAKEWALHIAANGLAARRLPPGFTHQE